MVDLDGTLVKNDLFFERLVYSFLKNPYKLIRSYLNSVNFVRFKENVIFQMPVSKESVVFNDEVICFITQNRSNYDSLILLSASPALYVKRVTLWCDLFDFSFGSTTTNLSGINKVDFLFEKGYTTFDYIGNSREDYIIYKHARKGFHFNGKNLCEV